MTDRLISADALLKEWRLECGGSCFIRKDMYCMHYDRTKGVCTLIIKAPTVEPIKHGRWKQIVHPWYECSECGERRADGGCKPQQGSGMELLPELWSEDGFN